MSGLEILGVVVAAYFIGRIQQWQKNREAVRTAEGLQHIVDTMRNQGKGNKE